MIKKRIVALNVIDPQGSEMSADPIAEIPLPSEPKPQIWSTETGHIGHVAYRRPEQGDLMLSLGKSTVHFLDRRLGDYRGSFLRLGDVIIDRDGTIAIIESMRTVGPDQYQITQVRVLSVR